MAEIADLKTLGANYPRSFSLVLLCASRALGSYLSESVSGRTDERLRFQISPERNRATG